jgi:hypothetical protein
MYGPFVILGQVLSGFSPFPLSPLPSFSSHVLALVPSKQIITAEYYLHFTSRRAVPFAVASHAGLAV